MTKRITLSILSLLLLLPFSCLADSSGDAPLTLLNRPQASNQAGPNPQVTLQAEELRDIQGPVPIPETVPYLLILGSVIGLLLIAALVFWYFKKRVKPALPPIPPWEKALTDLAEARELLSPERGLMYMDRASQILRHYIESRFTIGSTRQTTREFLRGLKDVGADSPLQTYRSELQGCLEQADMAKFAHYIPKLENLELMEDAVITFVKKTEPAPEPKGGRP